jgi:hypothetical protein
MSAGIRCPRCVGRPSLCGTLAAELTRQGHRSLLPPTVGRLLRKNGFSLQGTAKTLEGEQHPDRDAQFTYINEQVKAHQDAGEPVISIDAEGTARTATGGRAGVAPEGRPGRVEDHSFFTAGPAWTLPFPKAFMTSPPTPAG